MLRKKETFTVITPIPGFIPRQLALDILHSHSEVIKVNPLVLDHKPIAAPRDAAADEFYSTWYEIHQRIQFIPGVGKIGSSKISFNGCFHDMPWGLQTHIYAPGNVDLKSRYRIGGNQPGIEPPERHEMGMESLGAPKDGLYLREDIEFKCNVAMVTFVRNQTKAASKEMVQRIIKKAELLDAGILQAMMHEGRLKTLNPHDRSATADLNKGLEPPSGPMSPGMPPAQYLTGSSPNPSSSPTPSYQQPGHSPTYPTYARPGSGQGQGQGGYTMYHPQQQMGLGVQHHKPQDGVPTELPGNTYNAQHSPGYHHPLPSPGYQQPLQSPGYPPQQGSGYPQQQWQQGAPGQSHQTFPVELPAQNAGESGKQ